MSCLTLADFIETVRYKGPEPLVAAPAALPRSTTPGVAIPALAVVGLSIASGLTFFALTVH